MFENWEPPKRQYSSTTGERLIFSVYRGGLSLSVFGSKGSGRIGGFSIRPKVLAVILMKLKEMDKPSVPPNTKIFMTISHYDMMNKKSAVDGVIGIVKDDQLLMHLELRLANRSFVFDFNKYSDVSIGSDPIPQAQASFLDLHDFVNFLEHEVPMGIMLTREKPQTQDNRNNRVGNSGSNAPSAPPPSSTAFDTNDVDDIPFV